MVRYLNADVTLVRVIIAALVLFTGAGVALYVAAWLLIPEDGVDRRPPGPHPLTRTMTRTGTEKGRSAPAASGWPAVGTVTAYAAAIVAFASALMSLYWALGGHALVSTIGGYVEQFARRGGALPVLIALAATLAKLAGGLLALALVRPWGQMVPRVWLLAGSAGASALLVVYGGLTVLLGELVLLGVIHPSGSVDRTALRWHVGVWDLWFLVWGILLALATVGYWRRTATRARRDGTANRAHS